MTVVANGSCVQGGRDGRNCLASISLAERASIGWAEFLGASVRRFVATIRRTVGWRVVSGLF